MSDDFHRKVVEFHSSEKDSLETLRATCEGFNMKPGEVVHSDSGADLHLDPIVVAAIAYKVLTVVTTLGAAAQLIDWLYGKVKAMKASDPVIVVKIDGKPLELKATDDPESVKQFLEELLTPESQ